MIGSEGTLGFISEITYRTVPEHAAKASALILFDDLVDRLPRRDALKARAGGRGRTRSTARRCARSKASRACPSFWLRSDGRRRAARRDPRGDDADVAAKVGAS